MEERDSVDVVYMGTLEHVSSQGGNPDKNSQQDEIKFDEPVQIELVRIPHHGRDLYGRIVATTQKEPIKTLEIYYRNLDKQSTRFSLLTRSSSELLVSSTSDILLTLRETIYTDLLVIRGNFTTITLCIYGRLLPQANFPYFDHDVEVPLETPLPALQLNENIWHHSLQAVRRIEQQATALARTEDRARKLANLEARDSVFHEQQIKNICQLSHELLGFIGMDTIQEGVLAKVRGQMDDLQGNLSKLIKSAHIGLYFPPNYIKSTIPPLIPTQIVQTCIKLLSLNLSDQFRALEVLKLALQFEHQAKEFYLQGGVSDLIGLFLKFFNSDEVILSSLKSLLIEVFVALSFWDFSAGFFVSDIKHLLNESEKESVNSDADVENEKSESSERERERSRQKKKKKSKSVEPNEDKGKKGKKEKKDKKKDKKKDRKKEKEEKEKGKGKEKKVEQKQKQKPKVEEVAKKESKIDISGCTTFYQVLMTIMKNEKNFKLLQLLKILIQQITQTLTKNKELTDQMAFYTPLMRDVKYMFSQGGQIIGSKPLKMFVSFQPFLNEQQSAGVDSEYVSESQKIINCSGGVDPLLFSLIHEANQILSSRTQAYHRCQGEDMTRINDKNLFSLNENFMGLMSTLISKNQNGLSLSLGSFIDILKLDSLLNLKKHEAAIAMICEYIHEVLLEDDGTNLVYYMDQIHAAMLKISGWLKEDKTFSREIKRKVQHLINSVFTYNNFSGSENALKSFADYFVKLTGHQNFQINKITEYADKQFEKTMRHGDFNYLSDHFSMGNFFEVLPNQPLLEIDICLKMFLILLKFNRNIWTMFYEHKLVTSFSSLFIKMHSLLTFFFTPSLARQNALITLKKYELTTQNYLQVVKHITDLFIHKIKYESAFNELTEEQDIFDHVEMYEKSIELYVVLFGVKDNPDLMISHQKTINKIDQVLANIMEIYDNVLKAYEYTKHPSRENKIRNILVEVNRHHYASIYNRSAVFSFLRILVSMASSNSSEVLKNFLFGPTCRKPNDHLDLLLPANDKSPFQNLIIKNMYRGDEKLLDQVSGFMEEVMKKSSMKDQASTVLENILVEHEAMLKEHLQEPKEKGYSMQKFEMFVRLVGRIKQPMSGKLQEQMLRMLKWSSGLKNFHDYASEDFELQKLKLRNAFFPFFQSLFHQENELPLFLQVVRQLPPLLTLQSPSDREKVRCQHLQACFQALQVLNAAVSHGYYASIILYGDFFEQPSRPACEVSLQNIFSALTKKQNWEALGESQAKLYNKIAISAYYLIARLTYQNGDSGYFCTESRLNAINRLICASDSLNIETISQSLGEKLPSTLLARVQGYLRQALVEKNQQAGKAEKGKTQESRGTMYSRTVFMMISENDAIGKTRFEFIQDRWEGGDGHGSLYQVNKREDYLQLIRELRKPRRRHDCVYQKVEDEGLHGDSSANPLFAFKIKKIFASETKRPANTSLIMKTIPDSIVKPEEPLREPPRPYQPPNNPTAPRTHNPVAYQPALHGRSSSNNRDHSPYNQPTGPQAPRGNSNYLPNTSTNPNYFPKQPYQPPTPTPPYPQPSFEANKPRGASYDYSGGRNYDQNRGYDKGRMGYEQNRGGYEQRAPYYPPTQPNPAGFDPRYPQPAPGYGNPPATRYPPATGYVAAYGQVGYRGPSEEEMTNEAINLLLHLKSQGNVIEKYEKDKITSRVNQLVKNHNVRINVERYFRR